VLLLLLFVENWILAKTDFGIFIADCFYKSVSDEMFSI